MRPTCRPSAMFALVVTLAVTTSARAKPERVVIVRVSSDVRQTCPTDTQLAGALRTHTGLAVDVRRKPPSDSQGTVRVAFSTVGKTARVTVVISEREITHDLAVDSCAASAEVVAAFVATLLADTESVALPDAVEKHTRQPESMAPEHERARKLESLVRRRVVKRTRDVEDVLKIVIAPPERGGLWTLALGSARADCNARSSIDDLPADDESAAKSLEESAMLLVEKLRGCGAGALPESTESRAARLHAWMKQRQKRTRPGVALTYGAVNTAVGTTVGVLAVAGSGELSDRQRQALSVPAAIWLSGGVGPMLFRDTGYAETWATTSHYAGLAAFSFALSLPRDELSGDGLFNTRKSLHRGLLLSSVAYAGTAGFVLWDGIKHPRISRGQIDGDIERLGSESKRAGISESALASLENDLRRTGSSTSRLLMFSPLIAGSALSMALSFAEDDPRQRRGYYVSAVGMITLGALGAVGLRSREFTMFQDGKLPYGARLAVTPTGIEVSGKF